jgi:hypothetical protein
MQRRSALPRFDIEAEKKRRVEIEPVAGAALGGRSEPLPRVQKPASDPVQASQRLPLGQLPASVGLTEDHIVRNLG